MFPKKDLINYTHRDDNELIALYHQYDDSNALEVLFKRHDSACRHLVLNYCKNPEAVKDIMQETYIRAFLAIKEQKFNGGKFSSWLGKIGVNVFRMNYRSKLLHGMTSYDDPLTIIATPLNNYDPAQQLLHKEIIQLVGSSLNTLDPLQRRFVELWMEEGKDFTTIMKRLQQEIDCGKIMCKEFIFSYGNMRTRATRAREQFKSNLALQMAS